MKLKTKKLHVIGGSIYDVQVIENYAKMFVYLNKNYNKPIVSQKIIYEKNESNLTY